MGQQYPLQRGRLGAVLGAPRCSSLKVGIQIHLSDFDMVWCDAYDNRSRDCGIRFFRKFDIPGLMKDLWDSGVDYITYTTQVIVATTSS